MSRRGRQKGEKLNNAWEGNPAAPEPDCLPDMEAAFSAPEGWAVLLGPLLGYDSEPWDSSTSSEQRAWLRARERWSEINLFHLHI